MALEEPIHSEDLQFHARRVGRATDGVSAQLLSVAAGTSVQAQLDILREFATYASDSDASESRCLALLGPAKDAVVQLRQALDVDPPIASPGWFQELDSIDQGLVEISSLLEP